MRTMTSMIQVATISILTLSACWSGESGPRLSNSQARKILETHCSGHGWLLELGEFEVVRRGFVGGGSGLATIPARKFQELTAWESAGLIEIKIISEDDPRGSVERVVRIAPTERGRQLDTRPEKDGLSIGHAPCRVGEIVTNELMTKSGDTYRVVKGLYTSMLSDEVQRYYRARGTPHDNERKFQALLKFDPFEEKWTIVAYDSANRGTEFRPNTVATQLTG